MEHLVVRRVSFFKTPLDGPRALDALSPHLVGAFFPHDVGRFSMTSSFLSFSSCGKAFFGRGFLVVSRSSGAAGRADKEFASFIRLFFVLFSSPRPSLFAAFACVFRMPFSDRLNLAACMRLISS